MTLSTQTSRIEYTANGSQVTFNYSFEIFQTSDMKVYKDGVLQTSGYSVTGVGNDNGGTVVFSTAPASGVVVRLARVTAKVQELVLREFQKIPVAAVEKNFDKIVAMIQELAQSDSDINIELDGLQIQLDDLLTFLQSITLQPSAQYVGETQPEFGFQGMRWYNPSAPATYVFYYDGDSGQWVQEAHEGVDGALRSDLASPSSDVSVAGVSANSLIKKYNDFVSVNDFSGTARQKISTALSVSNRVWIPSGTYDLGNLNGNEIVFNLINKGSVVIATDKDVKFVFNTTTDTIPIIFNFENNSHSFLGSCQFEDLGYDSSKTWRGAFAIMLSGGNWGNMTIGDIYGYHLVGILATQGGSSLNRIRGINCGMLYADDCYYGINFQNQGDALTVAKLITFQCYRSYYCYGVTDHNVDIFSRKNRGSSGGVNVSRSSLNTSSIKIRYVCRDLDAPRTHVLINHIGPSTGAIENIDLDLDIDDTIASSPVKICTYTGSGGSETATSTANVVTGLKVKGKIPTEIQCTANFNTKGFIEVSPNIYLDAFTRANFSQTVIVAYTPILTATGTNPTLGDSSLVGEYYVSNGVCYVTIALSVGSTFNAGSGTYSFSLPIASKHAATAPLGHLKILRSGVSFLTGVSEMVTPTQLRFTTHSATNQVGSSTPYAWSNGDFMVATIAYPV